MRCNWLCYKIQNLKISNDSKSLMNQSLQYSKSRTLKMSISGPWLSILDVRKYLFINQILSDKIYTALKLIYFCIDSWIKLSFLLIINWIVLKFFNPFMDCYCDFKRKFKQKSSWMDLRNPNLLNLHKV